MAKPSAQPFSVVRRPDYVGHARGIKSALTTALIDTASGSAAVRVPTTHSSAAAVRRRVTAIAARYGFSVRTLVDGAALVVWFERKGHPGR